MSRIRNRIRFQSPEEQLLNSLLLVVVLALIAAGVWKLRSDAPDARAEVRGVQVTRSSETRATTGPAPTSTTSTLPAVIWFGFGAPEVTTTTTKPNRRSTTTTTPPPFFGFPPPPPTSPTTNAPSTTTSRPRPTTTTSTTTSTTTTTTTTSPPL